MRIQASRIRILIQPPRIRIQLNPNPPLFLESESESNCFESESGFEASWIYKAQAGRFHTFVVLVEKMTNSSGVIGTRNLKSGFESESESTLFFLNPNPDSYFQALNPNPNLAQKALNPDLNPDPDSDSHITGTHHVCFQCCNDVA